jgi:hypothetical protein
LRATGASANQRAASEGDPPRKDGGWVGGVFEVLVDVDETTFASKFLGEKISDLFDFTVERRMLGACSGENDDAGKDALRNADMVIPKQQTEIFLVWPADFSRGKEGGGRPTEDEKSCRPSGKSWASPRQDAAGAPVVPGRRNGDKD